MANTQKYLGHLLQNTGITPACSEEEREAADIIADVFRDHGFEPEVQEFTAKGTAKVVQAVLGIMVFVGSLLMGVDGIIGIVGVVLCIAAAVVYVLERMGKHIFSNLGAGGLSQNVIAYHQASGPLASPRNRPVVVVAHYDSPREDLLYQKPFSRYRSLLVKVLPFCMVAPAVLGIIQLFPIPQNIQVFIWIVAIIISVVPLFDAVAIIANRFVLPYTTGAVCNKSSVAAMLGVMDEVAPLEGEEFPDDVPFNEYFSEQQRLHEEELAAIEAERQAKEEARAIKRGESVPEESEEEPLQDASGLDTFAAETESAFLDDLDEGFVGSEEEFGEEALSVEDVAGEDVGGDAASEPVPAEAGEPVFSDGELEEPFAFDGSETYVEEQAVDEDIEAEESVADETVMMDTDELADHEATTVLDAEDEAPSSPYPCVNAAGNIRFGPDVVRAIGMLSDSCVLVYPGVAPMGGGATEDADDAIDPRWYATDVDAGVDETVVAPMPASDMVQTYETYDPEPFEVIGSDDASLDEESEAGERGSTVEVPVVEDEAEPVGEVQEGRSLKRRWTDWLAKKRAESAARAEAETAAEAAVASEDEQVAPDEDVQDLQPADEPLTEEKLEEEEFPRDDDVAGTVDEATVFWDPGQVSREPVADSAEEEPASEPTVGPSTDEPGVPASDSAPSSIASEVVEPATDRSVPIPSDESEQPALFDDESEQAAAVAQIDEEEAERREREQSEALDSIMAQINANNPAPARVTPKRVLNVPSTADVPTTRTPNAANHASLYDLPDPSDEPVDPFSSPYGASAQEEPEQDDADASDAAVQQPITNNAVGVDSAVPGDEDGEKGHRRSRWKGGASSTQPMSEEELREAITSLGDNELLGHDIWFVATGASEDGNAGINAFLDEHRDKLRGVFLINLECVGAGQIAMVSTEGEKRVLKGDKRIMNLMAQVSEDFHHGFGTIDMPYLSTDAYAAMSRSLRSLTLGGVDEDGFVCSHSGDDQPYNVDPSNIALVSDVVTEVIRRS